MRTNVAPKVQGPGATGGRGKASSQSGGIPDLRPQAEVRSGLQEVVGGSARVAQLQSMQRLANGGAVVQREKTGGADEPGLGDVASEQADALGAARSDMRGHVGRTLIGANIVPEPQAPNRFWSFFGYKATAPGDLDESRRFDDAAWNVIDTLLPELMNDIPFETTLAAVRFAQDIFVKLLRQHPAIVNDPKLEDLLTQHLKAVIGKLPIDPHAAEEDDEDAAEQDKKKSRTSDKRYKAARERVAEQRHKEEEAVPEPTVKAANDQYAKELGADFGRELEAFEKAFPKSDARQTIVKRVTGGNKERGYRLLVLLNLVPARGTDEFVRHLNSIYMQGFPSTHSDERITDAKAYRALGFFATDTQRDTFIAGSDTGQSPLMADFDTKRARKLEEQSKEVRKRLEVDKKSAAATHERNADNLAKAYEEARAATPADLLPVLKKIDPDVDKSSRAAIQLLRTATSASANGARDSHLLEGYEDYFARRNLPPSSEADNLRVRMTDALEAEGLLPGVDAELLKSGTRSAKAVTDEAVRDSWATKEEIALCSRLLGTAAFVGILDSHIRRQKPGPLRAMIEQLKGQSATLLKNAPPLKSTSLILDTNMVDLLRADPASVGRERKPLRTQLNDLIAVHGITDIRLANMNVAELSSVGRMVGSTIEVELNPPSTGGKGKVVSLPVLGVPYHGTRGSGKYADLFQKLEEKKVGENKGNADRSMMADILVAEREQEPGGLAVPHFATADMGVARELGVDENVDRRFGAANLGMSPVRGIGEALLHSFDQASVPKSEVASSGSPPQLPSHKGGAGKHQIWGFPIGATHRVRDITELIKGAGFQVLVVGGAVRDFMRGASSINDVDMKTDMPAVDLAELMKANGLQVSLTEAINLVTVGADDRSADIVSTSLSGPRKPIDLRADAASRDFTLNALYLDPTYGSRIQRDTPIPLPSSGTGGHDPLAQGARHAADGLLQFTADPGGPDFGLRTKAILAALQNKPENFGRALKFLQRGYKSWMADFEAYRQAKAKYDSGQPSRKGRKKPQKPTFKDKGYYHMEPAVLDMLRANAVHILAPLLESADMGPHKKGLFIHQSGFKTPMEMVDVMRRLNFPPEAIQMVFPDTVAGSFEDRQRAYARDVTPRLRSTGAVGEWDPSVSVAPVVKVDAATGRIYQYRMYAYAIVNDVEQKLLLDVDYSDHGVAGHNAPHYHVYLVNDKDPTKIKWDKKLSNLSRTGQRGEPPVKIVDGKRRYTGPQMWTWWPHEDPHATPAELLQSLKAAAAKAGIKIGDGDGDRVDVGGQIKLPVARLRQLEQNRRIPMLLQLVHNLNNGQPWNSHDDTVVELTGSKEGRERLRFKPQLEQVGHFLRDACKIKDIAEIKEGGKFDEDELARLYDLANGGYSQEACGAAARYALGKIANARNVADFVNFFEYYMAATENKVARADLDLLHKRTVTHAGATLSAVDKHKLAGAAHEEHLPAVADHLRFGNVNTAVYHLHKHLDMVDDSLRDLGINRILKGAARSYLELAQQTVKTGKLKKTVAETVTTTKYYYEKDDVVAIVEVESRTHEAHLLTCYRTTGEAPAFLTVPAEQGAPAQTPDKKSEKRDPNLPLQYYRTPFGTYGRLQTNDDGNCFFHAVRRSANLPDSAATLRANAVGELRTHYGRNFNGTTYIDFIDREGDDPHEIANAAADNLARDGHWQSNDGDLVPELMARALGRTIHILSRSDGSLVQTMGPANSNPIVIFYNGGSHYEASQPVG